ncbi:MAG: hypothetical protein ACK415_12925 [Thermodesulfovibrionales bacterium]
MFESVDGMIRFIDRQIGVESEDDCNYPEDARGFLLECPNWQCARGREIDSIESLAKVFNWHPEEIDPESEEYRRRVELARAKSAARNLYVFSELFKGQTD